MEESKLKQWHSAMEELVSSIPFLQSGVVKAATTALIRSQCASEEINKLWELCQAYAKEHGMNPHTVFCAQFMFDYIQSSSMQAPAACTVGSYKEHFVRFLDWDIARVAVADLVQPRVQPAMRFPGAFQLVWKCKGHEEDFAFAVFQKEIVDGGGQEELGFV